MSEFAEYSNGADGTCQDCGADTAEPYHAYCSACYRRQQGWDEPEPVASPYRPDPKQLRWQREDRARVTTALLVERIDRLEARVAKLERRERETKT